MGYLTTFTIFNDGLHLILEDSLDFCRRLYEQASRVTETNSLGHGYFATLVKVQKPRHADDCTTYVHMGNTVCEMNASSRETETLMRDHPKFFQDMLKFMRKQVGDLEQKFDECQAGNKSL
ncbi:hypothetical protein HYS49_03520 [Candidatus Woesearchaeota archaeon]|nr:hypothetical protein [Candidatus Woesearchaeota archaeon]